MNPSVRQQNELARTMKQFAFEESPMFQGNQIQEMSSARQFVYFDQTERPVRFEELSEKWKEIYQPERTVIELGFRAVRVCRDDDRSPIYCFEVSIRASRSLGSHDLIGRLSQDAWDGMSIELSNSDIDFDAEDASDDATLLRDNRRDEVIDALHEKGIDCETYQSEMLSFSTIEETIESSYERGYLINGVPYDVMNSHNLKESGGSIPEHIQTADGDVWISHRDQGFDGTLDVDDEIELEAAFGQIVEELDTEASIDFVPYEDKYNEMLYVIECLRKKVLLARSSTLY